MMLMNADDADADDAAADDDEDEDDDEEEEEDYDDDDGDDDDDDVLKSLFLCQFISSDTDTISVTSILSLISYDICTVPRVYDVYVPGGNVCWFVKSGLRHRPSTSSPGVGKLWSLGWESLTAWRWKMWMMWMGCLNVLRVYMGL